MSARAAREGRGRAGAAAAGQREQPEENPSEHRETGRRNDADTAPGAKGQQGG